MNNKRDDFETNLKSLENIVSQMDSSELTLTEALEAFEKGIGLFKACKTVLDEADQRVKLLVEENELGEMVEEDFNE